MFYTPDNKEFYSKQQKLKLKLGHVLFNFLGGWDLSNNISDEKAGWQYLSILFKILIIFPIKAFSLPLKILLNIAKIFTELLPTFASYFCAYAYRQIFFERSKSKNIHEIRFASVVMGILSYFHALTKTISLLGRAITSPEKSAKLAVAYAHEVKGKTLGVQVGTILGFIAGALSVAVSAALWAVALPLTLAAAVSYFPTVMNTIFQALTWISTLPLIAPTLSILNGITTAAVTALSATFSPIVMPLASLIGLQVSAAMLSIGTGLGVLLLPVATVLSRVADYYSDRWVCWHTGGPLTRWFSSEHSFYELPSSKDDPKTEFEPSRHAATLVDKSQSFSKTAYIATGYTPANPTPPGNGTNRSPTKSTDTTQVFTEEFHL
jgi:hypothetical protein